MRYLIGLIGLICVIWPSKASVGLLPTSEPLSLKETIIEAARLNKVPAKVLLGICIVESKLNPSLIHKDDGGSGSYGLCQIKLATARSVGFKGSHKLLLQPKINAYYAAKIFRYHFQKYNGNISKSIRAYNRGSNDGQLNTAYHKRVYLAMKGQ